MNRIIVTVKLFGLLASETERKEIKIELHEEADVSGLVDLLARDHRIIAEYRPHLLMARDKEYLEQSTALSDGDTVSLYPPLSGG